MGHSIPIMASPFQQMAEFFRHLVRIMSDANEMNFEKMRKTGGVEFEGTTDPNEVEQWLEHMERVFDQLECSDATKFKYAISFLQKDAYDWWITVPNAKAKPPALTWNDFVNALCMKYVPPSYCDAKKKEFRDLKQRSMFIAEYQQSFSGLLLLWRGEKSRNIQAAGSSGANQASWSRATARVYAMRQRDD
ncbi:uncharacterized protein LOC132042894 [Lycium ferocissimum]|uniref:uncharacterized protein LOC132042894 n=1 Tax=Lycium ferocissimum TaxID=112874 RepID=UPI002815A72F|nr:uncharacterized protein LOC132042894 [Lycium ferocissimum]